MWRWLESTKKLQTEIYRYDMDGFASAVKENRQQGADVPWPWVENTAHFINWNLVAAGQELAEVREEFSWKPWATDPPFANRERIIAEIVDTNHFLGNILVALGCTDEEYEAAYRRKQSINVIRAKSGKYSAIKGGLAQGSD